MATITKIETQKKNPNKVNLYIDDEFYHGLYLDTCLKYSLSENSEIELDRLDEIILESEKHLAFNKVVAYMGEGLKTSKQIRDYLKKKEYSKPTITYVIEKLTEYNFLNDEKYCEVFIKTYRSKYGKNILKIKLLEKGVSKEIVENALFEFESDDDEIYNILVKKLKNKTLTNDILTKTIRFMSSRGFQYDDVKNALERYKQENNYQYDEW